MLRLQAQVGHLHNVASATLARATAATSLHGGSLSCTLPDIRLSSTQVIERPGIVPIKKLMVANRGKLQQVILVALIIIDAELMEEWKTCLFVLPRN